MKLKQIEEAIFELEREEDMRVSGYVVGTKNLVENMKRDRTLEQLKNVASLPSIVNYALVMPDGHEGYGFPIGGVAAFDYENGIISPGGIGYDINCGVRLLTTNLTEKDILPKIRELTDKLFTNIPSGVGSEGKISLSEREINEVIENGAEWAVNRGYGFKEDLEKVEENGRMKEADATKVSQTAKSRGKTQLGTLGAGNHFLEVQRIEKIFDEKVAKAFGLFEGQIVVMIHSGSRGLGHQICDDYLKSLLNYSHKKNIKLKDKELVYAEFHSQEGQNYFKAMQAGVNFAFANRQIIAHWVRKTFSSVFGKNLEEEIKTLYDVAHNIAKVEEHNVNGKKRKLIVHRKGATRAFAKGREELPSYYREVGQPVIIPGSMGSASYILVGNERGMQLTFGSTCHGAGRVMSRAEAIRSNNPNQIVKELAEKNIYIRATEKEIISEEAPNAYKNIDEVVESVVKAGISSIVAKIKPISVIKG